MTANVGKAMRLKRRHRSRRCVGDLRAGPRDDVADVPRAARRHRSADPRGGRRRRERHHDEQGHDPRRSGGVRSDDVAGAAAVGECGPGGDRPEIVQIADVEEALDPWRRCGRAVHGASAETPRPAWWTSFPTVGRECAALGMPFIAEAEFPTTYATVEALNSSMASSTCAGTSACVRSWGPTSSRRTGRAIKSRSRGASRRRAAFRSSLPGIAAGRCGAAPRGWSRRWKRGRSGAPSGGTSSCTRDPRRSPGPSRGSSVSGGSRRRPSQAMSDEAG